MKKQATTDMFQKNFSSNKINYFAKLLKMLFLIFEIVVETKRLCIELNNCEGKASLQDCHRLLVFLQVSSPNTISILYFVRNR